MDAVHYAILGNKNGQDIPRATVRDFVDPTRSLVGRVGENQLEAGPHGLEGETKGLPGFGLGS